MQGNNGRCVVLKGISILMYHQVGPFSPMATHRSTYCSDKSFKLQMLTLAILGFKAVTMDEVLACVKGDAPMPPRAVCLTFDDGYENFFEYAYPVLKRYGFPATVYVLSGYIGKDALWFSQDGRDTPPIMTKERIEALLASGLVAFGSHGISHERLAEIPRDAMAAEVHDSKKTLEAMFGRPFRHFCYPYGSYNKVVLEEVKRAGYKSAVSCVRGAAYAGADPYQLPRKAISYGDSVLGFLWKLFIKNKRKIGEI